MSGADHDAGRQHLLRKLQSLARLSADDAEAILALPMDVQTWPANHPLVREGDTLSACQLILDGFACHHKSLPDGSRQVVSFHIPGDFLDLQGLQLGTMDYGVSTLVPTVVGRVVHTALHELTWRHPRVAAALWRDTLADAAVLREWMLCLGRRTAREHLAHLLCEVAWRFSIILPPVHSMPLTHDDLADSIGLTRVEVSRELEGLRRDGLIGLQPSGVAVLDLDGLARVCDFTPAYLHQDRAT
ncbi:Crp/Fnr family transcriptional regulator [Roseomonas elaeocarpi]|uniref:Crp/Fnr family transcriptional regulator n=1 Tax=Roseomonas elaeocarpi TaxID=907779 RepID=A0ABV6JWK4_9PROT